MRHIPRSEAHIMKAIDEIPSGEVMNSVISRDLLGWTNVRVISQSERMDGSIVDTIGGENLKGYPADFPKVSETMGAASRVIEAIAAKGYRFTLHFDGKRWFAWVKASPPAKADASAPELPLAICRAALKAILDNDLVAVPISRSREWRAAKRAEFDAQNGNQNEMRS